MLRVTSPQPDLSAYTSMPMSSYSTIPIIAAQNTPYQQQQQPQNTYAPIDQQQQQQMVYSPKHTANTTQLF